MKKLVKILLIIVLIISLFSVGTLVADRSYLRENVIRLHIRANSDSVADQAEKLAVRDVLLQRLEKSMSHINTAESAKRFLNEKLEAIESYLNHFLESEGSDHRARVSFSAEAFETREYSDFSLPAGVYDSLIVELGCGEGKNWWCVVFPSLCLQDFDTAAAASNMDPGLKNSLAGNRGYKVRFFILECFGKLQNIFQ